MKLLFDNNLSVKIARAIITHFPGSKHVSDLKIDHYPDFAIWDYAKSNHFCIITKDKDFYHLSVTYGHPPKVIWLLAGNSTNMDILKMINFHKEDIQAFLSNDKNILLLK